MISPSDREAFPTDHNKRRRVCAVALFVFFAVVYTVSRNHGYLFDGMIFANTVENPIMQFPTDWTFEWNHFLWYPTGRLFYVALHYFHIPLRGYQTLELLNAVVGAAGVTVTFLTLLRLATGLWGPLAWSLVSGFCAVYWARSAGAENYLFGTFWAVCFCYCLLSYWRKPSDWHMISMTLCSVLSAYYHLGNIPIVGAAIVAIPLRRFREKFNRQLLSAALLVIILWVPYAYVHHWFEPGGFSRWWLWSKGLADGYSPLQHSSGAFDWAIVENLPAMVQTFIKSVLWFESWSAGAVARLAAMVLLGTLAVFYRRRKSPEGDGITHKQGSLACIFLIPLLGVTALYGIWQPWNPIYWSVHTALFCLFVGAISLRQPVRVFSVPGTCLVLMIALLAIQNLRAVIQPDKINPRQFVINASLKIGQVTPAESPVFISGRGGEWEYLKVYLPYFAHRKRAAVDLFATNGIVQNKDPIVWMRQVITTYLANGVPVYVMDDILSGQEVFKDFRLSPEQIESLWKPYSLLPVLDFNGNPPNRLYLLWSNEFPKELQNKLTARLRVNGLLNQLQMVYSQRGCADSGDCE